MNPGNLKHRVTIQKPREVTDGYKTPITTWPDEVTVWAAVKPLQGREYIEAKNINAEVTHRVIMRYIPGIKPSMRVLFKNRMFEIKSVINVDEANKWLHLMCLESVSNNG